MQKIVCFDLETTGVKIGNTKYSDEVLQISMIDGKKNILFSDYVKPEYHTEWEEAAAFNGITPEMVKDKKTLSELKDTILPILQGADILLGYNSNNFDIPFLEAKWGVSFANKIKYDVMIEFKKNFTLYGVHNFKLSPEAIDCFGIKNQHAHDALGDVTATVDLYWAMQAEMKKPRLDTIYKMTDGKEIYGEDFAKLYVKDHKGVNIDKKLYVIDGKVVPENKVKDLSKYWTKHDFIKPGLYITDAKATAQVKKIEKAAQFENKPSENGSLPTIKKRKA